MAGLLERDAELGVLRTAVAEAAQSRGSVVLVAGEAGIGKTRLVARLAAHVRVAGGIVLEARCYDAERSLFLQPVVEVVRAAAAGVPPELVRHAASDRAGPLAGLVPEIDELLQPGTDAPASGEIERRRVFEAVASFLCGLARRRPVLVVLDDLHLAGASTVELLHFALRWDPTAPLLVATTVRHDEADLVVDHLGPRSIRLDLGPLPDDAVRSLAGSAGLADRAGALIDRTRGHTLFVVEALRALPQPHEHHLAEVGAADDTGQLPVPDSLRDAVLARLRRCGDDVAEVLGAAAVVGTSFELPQVAELVGLAPEVVADRAARARQAGLLIEDGPGYGFANDLIRDVLYDTTPQPTRAVRHRRLVGLADPVQPADRDQPDLRLWPARRNLAGDEDRRRGS
jgi:predicted ATPase